MNMTERGSRTRLLVVDDDDAVRKVSVRALEFKGFEATAVATGEEALQKLQTGEFDCMILDLTMPELSGTETLSQVRAAFPELPVLLSSGYQERSVETLLAQDRHLGFVPKPFTPAQLAERVEELLVRSSLAARNQ
jgi:CheY-like chemotaxis protein